MALEQKHNPLADARIDEHPLGIPTLNDMFLFRDLDDGITKAVLAANVMPQAPAQNFKWVPNKVPAYNTGAMVTREGIWYESLADNNVSIPGQSGTWQAYSSGSSNGGFYKPGVYSAPNVAVYSNHNGTTEIYELVNPTRPFKSVNIAVEEANGDWVSIMGQLRQVHISSVGNELILDCKHLTQIVFIVDNNIEANTNIIFLNHERLVWFKMRFVIAAPIYFNMPTNTLSSDPLFNETGDFKKRFIDLGSYSMEGTYDQENFWIEIFGPGRGTTNMAPSVLNHSIALVGNKLVRTRQYYDAEGDLENNPPPYITNLWMDGDAYPGGILTITYTFNSPMKYEEGPPLIQWYRMSEDFSNVTEIPGANGITYSPVFDDQGFYVFARIRVTQTAPAPANGNPTSNEWGTNALLIQQEVVGVEPLVPEEHFDNVLNLFDGPGYDAVNFRVEDTGLWSGAAYWTSPDAGSRPTHDAVNKRLRFDPAVTVRYIDAPIAASNSKGASGTRKYEWCGVIEFNTVPTGSNEMFIWAILTSYYFKVKNEPYFHFLSSSGAHYPFALVPNKKYRFRLRGDLNATTGFIEARLQLNFDESNETFEYDGVATGTNGGAGIAAGSTMRLGASKNVPPIRGFDGWVYEFMMLGQAHIDAQYELNLWRRLNLVAGL